MKKFVAVLGILSAGWLILGSLSVGSANSDSSPDLTAAFINLYNALVKVFALFGEFVMKMLITTYDNVPADLHCFFGVVFLCVLILSVLGLLALKTGGSLWHHVNRYE